MPRGFYVDFRSIWTILFCLLLFHYLSHVFFFILFSLFVLLFFCVYNIVLLARLAFSQAPVGSFCNLPIQGRMQIFSFLQRFVKNSLFWKVSGAGSSGTVYSHTCSIFWWVQTLKKFDFWICSLRIQGRMQYKQIQHQIWKLAKYMY